MKNYFLIINNEQKGPFNYDELIGMKIKREDQVWIKGENEWKNAELFAEFSEYFSETPPLFNSKKETGKIQVDAKVINVHKLPIVTKITSRKLANFIKVYFIGLGFVILLALIHAYGITSIFGKKEWHYEIIYYFDKYNEFHTVLADVNIEEFKELQFITFKTMFVYLALFYLFILLLLEVIKWVKNNAS